MTERRALARQLGVGHAVFLGLGAIVGTGVFVSIGIAAGVAGPSVILATAIAAVVATANALNSAQLAASHPVSGGTYEYGYRYLTPALGFSAGWMFLCAKTASAATAALGFAGYLLSLMQQATGVVPLAVGAVALVTLLVLSGMRQSARVNAAIVSITLTSLAAFCLAGLPVAFRSGADHLTPFFGASESESPFVALLNATALMLVAFTGYGRIATLGEEVFEPRRTIPRAIVLTLVVSAMLYIAVTAIAVGAAGTNFLSDATSGRAAPLEEAANTFGIPIVPKWVAVGAITAMLGVLLNLVLGLSRVVLAMARRGDLPSVFGRVSTAGATPVPAVLLTGVAVAGLTLVGSVKIAWSFSAFTVLVYYAVTNLAALGLPAADRLYPKWLAVAGLVACLSLAFFVEPSVWMSGLAVLGVGLAWHLARRKLSGGHQSPPP